MTDKEINDIVYVGHEYSFKKGGTAETRTMSIGLQWRTGHTYRRLGIVSHGGRDSLWLFQDQRFITQDRIPSRILLNCTMHFLSL